MANPTFRFPLSDYAGSPIPRKTNRNHTPTPAVLASVNTRSRKTNRSARWSSRIHSGVESTQRKLHFWNAHELLLVTNRLPNTLVSGGRKKKPQGLPSSSHFVLWEAY